MQTPINKEWETQQKPKLHGRMSELDIGESSSMADSADRGMEKTSIKSEDISCSDDSDDYYGIEEFDSMDDEVILSKLKD